LDPLTSELFRNGILGLVVAALIIGWLVPKWVLDEYRKREAGYLATIERQSEVIEKLAAKAGARHDDKP
jgi:hypothetical protein